MDQRILFVADYLRGSFPSFVALCEHYGISRKSGYKWIERYQAQGVEGLLDQSRRPASHPSTIPFAIRQAIIERRQQGRLTLGPKKIQASLRARFPTIELPCITSIHTILKRAGLIATRSRRRRVPLFEDPFAKVCAPNDLWSVDFKGQYRIGMRQWCYPLTVMDHHSRYLLGCAGLSTTATVPAKKQFERLFKEYGLPRRIRSDNGTPFASKAAGGLSTLSIWWIKLGIFPERIAPGQPQQNGQHERMHRTLKQVLPLRPGGSLRAQQRILDAFCLEYNEERPHEALNQQMPVAHYTPSPRPYPKQLPEVVYPDYVERKKVRSSGVVYWGNGQLYVSHLLQGEWIGMEQVDDGIWNVYFGPVRLGGFDERCRKGRKTSYWSITV